MTDIIQRFDERDNVFSRRDLKPGKSEYKEYYRLHPDWQEADDHFRSLPGLGAGIPDADMSMFSAHSWLMTNIGSPGIVDGKSAVKRVKISPEKATLKLKTFARRLGADLVGISLMNQAFAYSHRGRVFYPEEPYGSRIKVPHRFAISLGFMENPELIMTSPYHGEMMETGRVYNLSAVAAVVLAQYIRMLGYPARAHHFRNYQVLPVPLAVAAGLGELGRCGFLLTKQYGNCLRLSTVTADLPLECDKPVDIGVDDFCSMCRLCAEACPSDSIPLGDKTEVRGAYKWQMDAVSCITYWQKMGTDCGICIASCPWTQPDSWYHRIASDWASKSHLARMLLLWLYPVLYGKYRPRPLPEWLDPKVSNRNG